MADVNTVEYIAELFDGKYYSELTYEEEMIVDRLIEEGYLEKDRHNFVRRRKSCLTES